MTRICCLLLSFAILVAGTAHETPQQVVTRYNNYKAICNGMGFENVHCKDTIAFQSSLTKTFQNMRNHETVIFDKVSLNEGKAYDSTSGKFTAPLDGTYSFTWTTSTQSGKYFLSEIVRNGQPFVYNWTDGRGLTGSTMGTSHANIKMQKGDKAWIRVHGNSGQFVRGGDYSYFTGAKL